MYLLGYDIGSSSVKAALIEVETGKCVASHFAPDTEAPIKALKPGWAEQDPASWWDYVKECTADIITKTRINTADIKAIGISYQMHGLVAIDSNLRPLRDAIIWCDSRGVPFGEKAFHDIGPDKCLSRLLNSPGNFTAAKLCWIKENEPQIFDRIHKVMLPGDYIAFRMTGEISTNTEGLSEYMLWDFSTDSVATFIMDYFGIPTSILPDIRPTFSEQGYLTRQAADELGLSHGIPVTYRAGDQPNNALSLNVFEPGEIASTAGTSGVVYGINNKTTYDPKSRVNNFAHVNHKASDPRIGVMTCINGTGILNSWIKRNIVNSGTSYEDMNIMASKAPVGAGGISVLPFGNGAERILCNRQIHSSFHGIGFNTNTRSHLIRAAQEGIVFSFMYGIEIMKEIGLDISKIHAGNANMFLSPIFRDTLASVSGATIEMFDTDGAIGAAKGAGIGAGIYRDNKEAFASLNHIRTVTPASDRTPYLEAYALWKDRLTNELQTH